MLRKKQWKKISRIITSRSHNRIDSPEDLHDFGESLLDGRLRGYIAFDAHYFYIAWFKSSVFCHGMRLVKCIRTSDIPVAYSASSTATSSVSDNLRSRTAKVVQPLALELSINSDENQ